MSVVREFAGRHAVVTGAGRGLGRAIAERLAESGAVITAIDLESQLVSLPDSWTCVPIDLAAEEAQHKLAAVAREHTVVDILVANAGSVPPWPWREGSPSPPSPPRRGRASAPPGLATAPGLSFEEEVRK